MFRPQADFARVLLALLPLVGAVLIAISRCEDYRHDVYDVTVGSLLGLAVAHFTYRRYYPSLKSLRCDTPYQGRHELANAAAKLRDEEAGTQGAEFDDGWKGEQLPLQERSRERERGFSVETVRRVESR